MTEKITKITRTTEVTEYVVICGKCTKKITGSKESQVKFNLSVHKSGKECNNE